MSKSSFTFQAGSRLTASGAPGVYCQVQQLVENHTTGERNYIVSIPGSGEWQIVPATRLEMGWHRSSRFEVKDAEKQDTPPEPQDPDFDADGMPIERPDWV